ncbi:MAG: hypothetical protein KatS3mg077_3125 [Candidatus Binatia bacterium]|nr:MAG: hypothetical protein KatS3mg077_3125 [Candidatus Binatia bacterium]
MWNPITNGRGAPGASISFGVSLAAVAAFSILSFGYAARPETNDFERIKDVWMLVSFLICFLAWAAGYLRIAEEILSRSIGTFRPRQILPFLAPIAFLLLASFPVGSRDVFAYAFYGKMWGHYGANPYAYAPSQFSSDSWYRLLQAWWKEGPTGYGPLFILQTWLVYFLAGNNLVANVAAYKVFNLLLLSAGAYLWCAFGAAADSQNRIWRLRLVLWASSPLILFEGLSSAHNDTAMAVFLLAALFFWARARWLWFGVFWALSFWYKWYSIALLPVFAFWSAKRVGQLSTLMRVTLSALAGALLATAVALMPFAGQATSIIAKPLSIRVGSAIFPTELPPTLWPLFLIFFESGWFEIAQGRYAFDVSRYLIALALIVVLFVRRSTTPYRIEVVAEDCMFVLLVLSGFIVTVLWPWHLLAACSFGLLSHRIPIVWLSIGIMLAAMLSYFLTFSLATLGVGLTAIAIVFFRRRSTKSVGQQ